MTKIDYVDETWNVCTGCSPISEGCANCWAKRMALRLRGRHGYDPDEPFRPTLHEDKLEAPLRWRKPRRVDVCFMGDLFHEEVPRGWRDKVFARICQAKQHTFLLLTKRIGNAWDYFDTRIRDAETGPETAWSGACRFDAALPNLWLGVSVESQQHTRRIDTLLTIPAAVRWVSLEPLLGPVDLGLRNWADVDRDDCRLDWVVAGAETGPGARPADPDWFRLIRDDCKAAGVPFWLKSLGPGQGDTLDGVRYKELPV